MLGVVGPILYGEVIDRGTAWGTEDLVTKVTPLSLSLSDVYMQLVFWNEYLSSH